MQPPCPLPYHADPNCLSHTHAVGPRFLWLGAALSPWATSGIQTPPACVSLLTGIGHFHTHLASQKKRARRKHSCILKAIAHMPMARSRSLATARCQARRGILSLASHFPTPTLHHGRGSKDFGSQLAFSVLPLVSMMGWPADSGHSSSRRMKATDHDPRWAPPQDLEAGVLSKKSFVWCFSCWQSLFTSITPFNPHNSCEVGLFISQIRKPKLSSRWLAQNSYSWDSMYSHRQILGIVVTAKFRRSLIKIFYGEGRGVGRAASRNRWCSPWPEPTSLIEQGLWQFFDQLLPGILKLEKVGSGRAGRRQGRSDK